MKWILNYCLLLLPLAFLSGCSTKESATASDYDTLRKDEIFRAGIKTGSFIKLSAGYTYYEFETRNADTLLVLVHGFSVPSYIWDSTYYAAIKRGYGALRYDTYGRGYSDNPDVMYDVAFFSNQLKELLDSLKITKPINLIGLSDGGRTISVFAFQYPARVKNLVYVDAAGFNTLDSVTHPASVSEEEILAFKKDRYATLSSGQMTDFYDSVPFRGWDKKYEQLMRYKGFVRALISTNKNRTDLENEHRQVAASGIPVFAIWGDHDTVVKLEDVRTNLVARMPKVKLFVIPKAGHLPHMEKTKLFNSILFDSCISPPRTGMFNPFDTLQYDRAVAYDYDGEGDRYIVKNGQLIKEERGRGKIFRQKDVNKNEVVKFHKFIGDTATYGGPTASCFDPHLGIVYYKKKKIVGHISICLDCNYLVASMKIPASDFKKKIVGDSTHFPYAPYGFTRLGRKKINDFCKTLGFTHCKKHLETTLFGDYEALDRILLEEK